MESQPIDCKNSLGRHNIWTTLLERGLKGDLHPREKRLAWTTSRGPSDQGAPPLWSKESTGFWSNTKSSEVFPRCSKKLHYKPIRWGPCLVIHSASIYGALSDGPFQSPLKEGWYIGQPGHYINSDSLTLLLRDAGRKKNSTKNIQNNYSESDTSKLEKISTVLSLLTSSLPLGAIHSIAGYLCPALNSSVKWNLVFL